LINARFESRNRASARLAIPTDVRPMNRETALRGVADGGLTARRGWAARKHCKTKDWVGGTVTG
jgi:hypothetical protein